MKRLGWERPLQLQVKVQVHVCPQDNCQEAPGLFPGSRVGVSRAQSRLGRALEEWTPG